MVRTPTFAGTALERDEHLRRDSDRQKEGWGSARVLVVDQDGLLPVTRSESRLWTRAGAEFAGSPPPEAMLLGEADGTAYWVLRGAQSLAGAGSEVEWLNGHVVGGEVGSLDGALLATAVGLVNWHDRARFCTRDGSPTMPVNAGWARACEAAGHEEYPRTDPAVIVLVHDGGDRALLGRHRAWPPGRFSVLAGFVEAGESLEACVVREIAEEVGVGVTDVRYLGSQAWPFPRSLMIGFHALADPGQPLRLDETEISEARWMHRDELREALARGEWRAAPRIRSLTRATMAADVRADADVDAAPPLLLPGRVSIARNMIESWVAAG
ncbi:NAD(+) diphosphatase [Frankia sp. R82]|uniref:NAD(+) diphosphatase n=1 Tax=Frankia sp. R82 TaxID=2950553 RepID=UPI00255A966D